MVILDWGGPKCNIAGVLIKRRESVQREICTEEEDGERYCSDAATSQGKPGATRRVRKTASPGGFSRRLALLIPWIEFGLLVSRSVIQ